VRSTTSIRSLLIILLLMSLSAALYAQVGIIVSFGPPALPVYAQPLCPGPGYLWTPGYWAWDPDFNDYYWVPGTWILPPEVSFLWTPGYWGWNGAGFIFYEGYWGPFVGFYGGINYGFGYFGHGYEGGRWDHGQFYYNREVNNINVTNIHNVYNTRITTNNVNHVSYNGGEGGINARPTPQEEAAAREKHISPVAAQFQQTQAARENPELRASANHGKPPIAATQKAGEFQRDAVAAGEAGAPYHPPANRVAGPAHASQLPTHANAPVHTGTSAIDQQNQREQEQLNAQQNKEHQQLQQQQEQEHEQLQRQQANQEAMRQTEQRHQQQASQMEQQHFQQQQQMHMQQMQRAPESHGAAPGPRRRM